MFGSNYDPNNDQQSSADSDLLGNNTNAMLQAQTATMYLLTGLAGGSGEGEFPIDEFAHGLEG